MGRIQSLDGWRGVAIGLVILAHLVACAEVHRLLDPRVADLLGGYGMAGVQIFFVISGYVITRGLLADEREGGISLRAFYVRRAFRILPALWIFLAALVVLGIDSDTAAAALFLCNTNLVGECAPIVGHTWSLAFEEQFYLLLPAMLMLWIGRRRPPLALAVGAVAIALLPLVSPDVQAGRELFFATYAALAGGVLVALYEPKIRAKPLWIVAAVLTLLVAPRLHPERYAGLAFALVELLRTVGLAAAMVILVFSVRGKWISAAPLAYLGRISYSVYLWQELATSEDLQVDLAGRAVLVALLFVFTAVSYHTIEAFFRSLGRRYSDVLKEKSRARRPFVVIPGAAEAATARDPV